MSKQKKNRMNAMMVVVPLVLGAGPAALTAIVDPYEFFDQRNRASRLTDIAEKAHYPLWKLARYSPNSHDTIVLGDSRARALRDKYWHELGMDRTLNLAYGGGTIPEIYETFLHLREDDAVENIVVGIQLRSFDEDHKGGMNRVPEAIRIVADKTEYLKNWAVSKTALRLFQAEHRDKLDTAARLLPHFVGNAKAGELGNPKARDLSALVDHEICFRCQLPNHGLQIAEARNGAHHFSGFGRGNFHPFPRLENQQWRSVQVLYDFDHFQGNLPPKHESQVNKGGTADWRGFEFSTAYWQKIHEISEWSRENDKRLIFVIPPTVTKLQQKITEAGLGELNHQFRSELAKLGEVLDFDYPNALTADARNFTDAYHFNAKLARQIVGEIAGRLDGSILNHKRYIRHQDQLQCVAGGEARLSASGSDIQLGQGQNCRIWTEQKK